MNSVYKNGWSLFNFNFIRKGFLFITLHLSKQFFIPPFFRPYLLSVLGVKFSNKRKVYIGVDVLFDTVKNSKTYVGENVLITTGVKILNHFPKINSDSNLEFYTGDVYIKDNVFIGMNSLIVKPVVIGENSIIAAGSVVINDVKPNSLVGGNPAKLIRYI